MADIELVIKIDEVTYKDIKKGKVYSSIRDVPQESVLAIANGTPLPKGHGRLIDADALISDGGGEWNGIGISQDTYSERVIKNAPTILESDKADGDECVDKALMPLIDEGYEPDIRTNVEEG